MKQQQKWEVVEQTEMSLTERMVCEEGWLYRSWATIVDKGEVRTLSMGMAFVPDNTPRMRRMGK